MSNSNIELYRSMRNLVRTIKRKSIRGMKEKYGNDVNHSEFRVMLFISAENGTSMGEIASRWSMHMSNLTKVVNSLIERGYAYKKQSEEDRRIKMIFLTEEGSRIKNKYIKEFEEKINKSLEEADDNIIKATLNSVNEILGQIRGE